MHFTKKKQCTSALKRKLVCCCWQVYCLKYYSYYLVLFISSYLVYVLSFIIFLSLRPRFRGKQGENFVPQKPKDVNTDRCMPIMLSPTSPLLLPQFRFMPKLRILLYIYTVVSNQITQSSHFLIINIDCFCKLRSISCLELHADMPKLFMDLFFLVLQITERRGVAFFFAFLWAKRVSLNFIPFPKKE